MENVKYPEHLTVIYDPQNLDPDTRDEKPGSALRKWFDLLSVDTDIKQT